MKTKRNAIAVVGSLFIIGFAVFRIAAAYWTAWRMHKVADDIARFFPAGLPACIVWLHGRGDRPVYVASTKPDCFTVQRVTEMMYPEPVRVYPPLTPSSGSLVVQSLEYPLAVTGEVVFAQGYMRVLRVD